MMMFKIFIAADDYNFGAQMFKTTVTMVAILAAILDFTKNWKSG